MNVFKEMFSNLEGMLNLFYTFDFSKLILILLVSIILFIAHLIILNHRYKLKLNKINIEFKKLNVEATLSNKRNQLFKFYIILFFIFSFFVIVKENLGIIIPIISGLIVISIISLKEQLNNIFLGFLFKSSISTTVHQDMLFYFKEDPNDICKICKVNLFKTIYKNERTGKLNSIENKHLNESNIIHKVLNNLDYVEFKYILNTNVEIEKYLTRIRYLLDNFIEGIDFTTKELKDNLFILKAKYNSAPYLKPFYNIDLKYKNKDELEVIINITTYSYNFDNYLEDFIKYSPFSNKEVNEKNEK